MSLETQTSRPSLAPSSHRRLSNKNIIAVASGKGGVGKTWISVSLAQAIAKYGKKILLVDGDLGLANIDIQLALVPHYDLAHVMAGQITLNQAIVKYTSPQLSGHFDIIAGRSGSGALSNIPLSRLQNLSDDISLLSNSYDYLMIDLGAGVDKTIRTLSHIAGSIIVVTNDEPTSLTDAYAFIKLTQLERPGTDMKIVINMANSAREGERIYSTLLKACEGFLKFSPSLLGIVRRDLKVRDAIRNQTSIFIRSPNSEAAFDIEIMAKKILTSP
jgi:flagellar biosynthesis protein FlhG